MDDAKPLFSYRKHWAHRFGPAPFLPMSAAEVAELGWGVCDIILVTGDAYVDHPSFGMAIVGRLLEAQGFRVGIIAQPDWNQTEAFRTLGRPRLFFGVTAGNMDSMVNRYTADRRLRHDDAYSPEGQGGRRPDRAVIVYAQRCREAFREVPIVIGGIEASLRRFAHYDYWSDKIRRSILVDSKADLLVYGNAERAVVEIAHRAAQGAALRSMHDIRGIAVLRDAAALGGDGDGAGHGDGDRDEDEDEDGCGDGTGNCARTGAAEAPSDESGKAGGQAGRTGAALRVPGFDEVQADRRRYALASRLIHLESNPGHARPLVQRHGDKDLWVSPPACPLTTAEMDGVYGLPYARAPHPAYGDARIPAYEMIRFSVTILRGCFGGCSFCSITGHEGRIIQSRSERSILGEIETIRETVAGFTGVISDLGGPTANMYRMSCTDARAQALCRRPSCLYPAVCKRLDTRHRSLIQLYRAARSLPGVRRVLIASGVRYDLALCDPAYVEELVGHHVGGYLKVAPEHTEPGPLARMMKPDIGAYDRFRALFESCARKSGQDLYLIPYFIAAHPGTTDQDMLALALWLKRNRLRLDHVQTFLPSPMSVAATMYYSGIDPLRPVPAEPPGNGAGDADGEVYVVRGLRQRRLHKAFLRYHDAENWPLLRDALKQMGRADLIGPGKHHLIPAWQPAGTGGSGGEGTRMGRKHGRQVFLTQPSGPEDRPRRPR